MVSAIKDFVDVATETTEGIAPESRDFRYLLVSHYLTAPQNHMAYEGIRWSKISWEASSPWTWICAQIRFVSAIVLLSVPMLVGSFSNLFVQSRAVNLQGERGFSCSGSSPHPIPDRFRVLSLNICTFPGGWHEFFGGIPESGHDRMDRFVELFKREQADIICLQEVFAPAFALEMKNRLQKEGWSVVFYNAGLEARLPMTSGLFVASRLPITEARYIPFESSSGGWLPRGALQLAVGNVDLLVTHLSSSDNDLDAQPDEINKRKIEIQTIAQHLRDRPTLLVGDLNAQPTEFSTIGSLVDAYPNSEPTCTEQFTLDAIARLNNAGKVPLVPLTTLDRVFSHGIDTQTRVSPSFGSTQDPLPLSDHHALVIELTTPRVLAT